MIDQTLLAYDAETVDCTACHKRHGRDVVCRPVFQVPVSPAAEKAA